jgi:hypothetical protein
MRSLPELQSAFAQALAGAAPAEAALALSRGPAARAAVALDLYRGNVRENCAQALASAFPIVRKIVGADFFAAMARAAARAQPSESGDLHRYGARFAEFLQEFPPVADLPYLPDVARMEWLAHLAYFAADARRLDTAAIAALPQERVAALRPRLAPACALLASPWPLGRLWTVHQDHFDGAFEVDLDAGPDRVLVCRPRWRAEVCSLAQGEFVFLDAAQRGAMLGDALAAAAAADAAFDPADALARWTRARVIDRLV